MAEIRVVFDGKFVGTLPRPKQRCDAVHYTLSDGPEPPELASLEWREALLRGTLPEATTRVALPIYPFWVDDPDNPVCAKDTASDGWCIEFAVLVFDEQLLGKVRQISGWKANPPKRIIELPTF